LEQLRVCSVATPHAYHVAEAVMLHQTQVHTYRQDKAESNKIMVSNTR
jgi:hypothetical protein